MRYFFGGISPRLDAEGEARPGGERQGDDEAAGQHQRGADTSAPGGVTQRLAAARHQSEASWGRPPANHSSPAVAELVAGVGPVAVGLARHVARPLGGAAPPSHLALCTTLSLLGGSDNVWNQLSS